MTVYVKEIKGSKFNLEYIDGQPVIKRAPYNILLPHLVERFRNKSINSVAVQCFPPIIDKRLAAITEYIRDNRHSEDALIFFDNVYEGHITSCIHGIHSIINTLRLNPEKCYFISGGMEARQLYSEYRKKHGITKEINIIVLNSWERHLSLRFFDQYQGSYTVQHHIKNKEKLFLCFNRIVRPHRVSLLGLLYGKGLVDCSYYSFFPDVTYDSTTPDLFKTVRPYTTDATYEIIRKSIQDNQSKFPLIVNNTDGSNTNTVMPDDNIYYENSYFSLVTETFFYVHPDIDQNVWDERSVFFSEKIFKPILCKHPFVLVSRPNSLHYLRKLGYKTFHPWINESYDTIQNDEERMLAIVDEVERLSKQTPEQWIEWLKGVAEIVEHNHKVIVSKTRDEFEWFE